MSRNHLRYSVAKLTPEAAYSLVYPTSELGSLVSQRPELFLNGKVETFDKTLPFYCIKTETLKQFLSGFSENERTRLYVETNWG